MRIKNSLVSLAAGAAVVAFVGCSKSETPAPGDASTAIADTAKDDAGKDAVNGVTGQFTEGLANAKKFIADKNYQGALAELTKLSSLKLTDEQTKVADSLKAEVQALIAKGTGGAEDAAKDLLGK